MVPCPDEHWWYYTRSLQGLLYVKYCRAPKTTDTYTVQWKEGDAESPILPGEVVYLDVNALARNRSTCNVGDVTISPTHELVAYTVDYSGGESYEVHVREIDTGKDVALQKSQTSGTDKQDDLLQVDGLIWGHDNQTLYYTTMDAAHRSYRLYMRHNWEGRFQEALLKEEQDPMFACGVGKSLDKKYIFYTTESAETSEVWYLDLTQDDSSRLLQCVAPRQDKVQYDVEVHEGRWYITTNAGNPVGNLKLMSAPAKPNSASVWELVEDGNGNPIFDGTSGKSLDAITAFKTHAVLEGWEGGIPHILTYSFYTRGGALRRRARAPSSRYHRYAAYSGERLVLRAGSQRSH